MLTEGDELSDTEKEMPQREKTFTLCMQLAEREREREEPMLT